MGIAKISSASTEGLQSFPPSLLRTVPIPEKKKRPRDFSLGATLR